MCWLCDFTGYVILLVMWFYWLCAFTGYVTTHNRMCWFCCVVVLLSTLCRCPGMSRINNLLLAGLLIHQRRSRPQLRVVLWCWSGVWCVSVSVSLCVCVCLSHGRRWPMNQGWTLSPSKGRSCSTWWVLPSSLTLTYCLCSTGTSCSHRGLSGSGSLNPSAVF